MVIRDRSGSNGGRGELVLFSFVFIKIAEGTFNV